MRALRLVLPGLMFGAGLALAGMTDPARVLGFLDVAGAWDPTLAFVMGGAVATFMVLRAILPKGNVPECQTAFRLPDRRTTIGAALFGIGWGLGGFCPGPGLANLAWLRTEAVVFVLAMLVGMRLAQVFFGADKAVGIPVPNRD